MTDGMFDEGKERSVRTGGILVEIVDVIDYAIVTRDENERQRLVELFLDARLVTKMMAMMEM